MKNIIIKAIIKKKKGSNYNNKIRKKKLIPAILYGNKKENISIIIKHDEIFNKIIKYQKNNKKIIFKIKFKNNLIISKIKHIQTHQYKNKIIHIDFIY